MLKDNLNLWPESKCYHKTCVCMLDLLGATAKETKGISEQQNMLPHLNDKICMPRALYNILVIQASNSAGRSSTKDNQLKHA
jgi:hypothetical protein